MISPVLFQNQPALELQDGIDRILIAPEHGARILRWTQGDCEVIRWPDNADWSQVIKVRGGNPILFPFVARHFVDGVAGKWQDSEGVVRSMPVHGFARDAAFTQVDESSNNTLRLRLKDNEASRAMYPFAFQFDVVLVLHPSSRLEIRFETTNCGDEALPYYAGHHFYFALPHQERSQWKLHLPCKSWGRQTPTGEIIHQEPTAETFSVGDASLIDRFQIHPLDSKVVLAHSDGRRRITLELQNKNSVPWYAVTTWTEFENSDFYCIEPWLGLPNAIHHGEGLRWLPPGEVEIATCVIDAGAWA